MNYLVKATTDVHPKFFANVFTGLFALEKQDKIKLKLLYPWKDYYPKWDNNK